MLGGYKGLNTDTSVIYWMFPLIVYLVFGYLDWKYREIDPEHWYPLFILGSGIGFHFGVSFGSFSLYLMGISVSLIFVFILLVVYYLGVVGGADVYALLLIAVSMPVPLHGIGLPPVLSIILYSSLLGLVYKILEAIRVVGLKRSFTLYYKVDKRIYLESDSFKWWVPREIAVESDLSEELAFVKKRFIEITPGIPMITMLFFGLLIYVFFGDLLFKIISWIMG